VTETEKHKKDIHQTNMECTPLLQILSHYYARHVNLYEETLVDLLQAVPSLVYRTEPGSGRTLLHQACLCSQELPSPAVVRRLAGRSFLAMIQDKYGNVPLHYACGQCSSGIVRMMSRDFMERLMQFIEFCPEAAHVMNAAGECAVDVYRDKHGFVDSEGARCRSWKVLALLESLFEAPPTPEMPINVDVQGEICTFGDGDGDGNSLQAPVKSSESTSCNGQMVDVALNSVPDDKDVGTSFTSTSNTQSGISPLGDISNLMETNRSGTYHKQPNNTSVTENSRYHQVSSEFWLDYVKVKAECEEKDNKLECIQEQLAIEKLLVEDLRFEKSNLEKVSADLIQRNQKLEGLLILESDLRKQAEEYVEVEIADKFMDAKEVQGEVEILTYIIDSKEEEVRCASLQTEQMGKEIMLKDEEIIALSATIQKLQVDLEHEKHQNELVKNDFRHYSNFGQMPKTSYIVNQKLQRSIENLKRATEEQDKPTFGFFSMLWT